MDGFLLDYWGNILDFDENQGVVVNRRIDAASPKLRVSVEGDVASFSFRNAQGVWEGLSVFPDRRLRAGETLAGSFSVSWQRSGVKYPAFGYNGLFLSVSPDGTVAVDKTRVFDWETFRFLSEDEFRRLTWVTEHAWYSRSQDRIVAKPVPVRDNFTLDFSGLPVRIDDLFEVVSQSGLKTIDVFYDTWRLERLELFNPVIYCCSFGRDEAFESLEMTVESLRRFAGYDGDIKVLTERDPEEVRRRYASLRDEKVGLVPYVPLDLIDYMSSRFDIGNYEEFQQYQPILYLDTDIIVGRSVDDLFLNIIRDPASAVYVYVETRAPAEANYWGKELFDNDPFSVMPDYGFSTGVMAFRTLDGADSFLKAVRQVIFRQSRELGSRLHLRCYDQPVANYVLAKMGCSTDAQLLNRFVVNFDMKMNHVDTAGYDAYVSALREPVLHFAGGVGGYDWKLGAMRRYREWLLRPDRVEPERAVPEFAEAGLPGADMSVVGVTKPGTVEAEKAEAESSGAGRGLVPESAGLERLVPEKLMSENLVSEDLAPKGLRSGRR